MASCLPLLAADAGLHHHVPDPPRPDVQADRRRRRRSRGVLRGRRADPPAELGFVPRYISHTQRALPVAASARHEMMSFGLDLAKSPGRGAQRRASAPGSSTPCSSSLLGVPLLRPAADGRRPGRGQPDDVARAAEADAVPAGRVRRLPGVLPDRPDHLLHGPGDPAHRPAGLHHPARSTGTTSRSAARRSGPATRPASWPRPTGRRRRRPVRPGQAGPRGARRTPGKPAQPPAEGGRQGRRAGRRRPPRRTTKRTTAPKGRPTPTGKARRPAAELDVEPTRRQPDQERRQAPALTSAATEPDRPMPAGR